MAKIAIYQALIFRILHFNKGRLKSWRKDAMNDWLSLDGEKFDKHTDFFTTESAMRIVQEMAVERSMSKSQIITMAIYLLEKTEQEKEQND